MCIYFTAGHIFEFPTFQPVYLYTRNTGFLSIVKAPKRIFEETVNNGSVICHQIYHLAYLLFLLTGSSSIQQVKYLPQLMTIVARIAMLPVVTSTKKNVSLIKDPMSRFAFSISIYQSWMTMLAVR